MGCCLFYGKFHRCTGCSNGFRYVAVNTISSPIHLNPPTPQNKNISFKGRDADDETLDQSEIRVWLDMSNQQIGILLNRDLQLTYRDFAQGLLKDCDNNPKLGDIPIQFKEPIYGTSTPSFTDFVAPGVILT